MTPYERLQQRLSRFNGGTTQTDQELIPYIQQIKDRDERKRSLLTPVEKIFDLLQRGQYASANVANELVDWGQTGDKVEIVKALWEGVTGKTKGSYEDVFKKMGVSDDPIFGEKVRGVPILGASAAGILGFLGDVLLDPMTYVGFGPTKAAKAAGSNYATDVMRMFAKEVGLDPSQLGKLASNIDVPTLKRLAAESPDAANKYLMANGGDLARKMEDMFNEALRTGTREPVEKLRQMMSRRIDDFKTTADDLATKATYNNPDPAVSLLRPEALASDYDKAFTKLTGPIADIEKRAAAGWGASGERGINLFGKELNKGVRYPEYVRHWDQAQGILKKGKIGQGFAKAKYALTGPQTPIGQLKAMFGVRNPYQQMLRDFEMSKVDSEGYLRDKALGEVTETFKGLDPEALKDIHKILLVDGDEFSPDMIRMKYPDKAEAINGAIDRLRGLGEKWAGELDDLASRGLISDVGELKNYVPIVRTEAKFRYSFFKKRKLGWKETGDVEAQKLATMIGTDTDTARDLVAAGIGTDVAKSLEEAYFVRALAQAKVVRRAQIVEQMREFGFNMGDAVEAFGTHVNHTAASIGGLAPARSKALEGYVFDSDVQKVLDNVSATTQNDQALAGLSRALNGFTKWIKSFLVLSPGFHSRNFASNNFQGIINYGVRWGNQKHSIESAVATMYGLHGEEFVTKWAKRSGIGVGRIDDILSRKYNGQSLRELSEEAARTGVITREVKGFDFVDLAQPKTKKDSLLEGAADMVRFWSTDFTPIKVSHEVGNVIESTPKFKAFLLSYMDTGDLHNSVLDAKKIFFDYADLTQTERQVFQKIIPFYTWSRKNLSRQVEQMTRMVEMYSLVPKLEERMKSDEADRELLPEWMRMRGQFPIERDITQALQQAPVIGDIFKGSEDLAFWPNMPYADLNVIPLRFQEGNPIPEVAPKEFLDEMVGRMHPTLKSIAEAATNRDVYYKNDLGKMKEVRGMRALNQENPYVMGAIDSVLKALGQKNGLPFDVSEKGDIMLPSWFAVLIEENIPVFRQIGYRFLSGAELVEPILRAREKTYDGEQDADGLADRLNALSFYMGIKFNAYSEDKERQRIQEDILREAEQERYDARKSLPGYETRSSEYWRNRNLRASRLVNL